MPENPAYDASSGAVRAWVTDTAGKQPGDPAKAARAIAAELTNTRADRPLRLPLGADAVDNLRQKLARLTADIDRTEQAARATAL